MGKLLSTCAFLIIIFTTVKRVKSIDCADNEIERWGVKHSDSCLANHYNLTERRLGCFCKDRHKRNKNGKCVLEEECPEEDECGIKETKRLRMRGSDSCFDKLNNSTEIEMGCLCDDQYRRDQSGRCIPKKDCPKEKKICKDNEIGRLGIQYSDNCNCSHYEDEIVIYDCFCEDGYKRDQIGACILKEKCKTDEVKCKENEEFRCSKDCERTCYNVYQPCEKKPTCKDGCYCVKGYARNPEGVCITDEECRLITTLEPIITTSTTPVTKPLCGGENEVLTCGYGCQETCAGAEINCTATTVCEDGCYCKDGYVRNANNTCFLKSECREEATDEDKSLSIPPLIKGKIKVKKSSTSTKETTTETPITTDEDKPLSRPPLITVKKSSTSTKETTTETPITTDEDKPLSRPPLITVKKSSTSTKETTTETPITTDEDKPLSRPPLITVKKSSTSTKETTSETPITTDEDKPLSRPPLITVKKSSTSTKETTTETPITTDEDKPLSRPPLITVKKSSTSTKETTTKTPISMSSTTELTTTNLPSTDLKSKWKLRNVSKPSSTTTEEPTSTVKLKSTTTMKSTTTPKEDESSESKDCSSEDCVDYTILPYVAKRKSGKKSTTPVLLTERTTTEKTTEPCGGSKSSESKDCSRSEDCVDYTILPYVPKRKSGKKSTTPVLLTVKTTTEKATVPCGGSKSSESKDCSRSEDCVDYTILPYVPKRKYGKKSTTPVLLTVKTTTEKATVPCGDGKSEKSSESSSQSASSSESSQSVPKPVGRTDDSDSTEETEENTDLTPAPNSEDDSCDDSCETGTIKAYQHASSSESDERGGTKVVPHKYLEHKMPMEKKCERESCKDHEGHDSDDCGSDGCKEEVVKPAFGSDSSSSDSKSRVGEKKEEEYNNRSSESHGESCGKEECDEDDDKCLDGGPKLVIIPKPTKKSKTPTCRNKNEEYKCNYGCEVTCGSYGKPCLATSKTCKEGCFCIKGFARNAKGECIPIAQCNTTCSDPKEEYKCNYGCEPNCSLDRSECVRLPKCKFSCVCISGYVRGANGRCILSKDCAKERCSKPYEEYRCSYGCETECSTIGKLCHSKRTCRYGCFCIEDFARDSDNNCIPIDKCKNSTNIKCKGRYEESKLVCEEYKGCKQVCSCKEGYGRGVDGKCAAGNKLCTKVHEEFRCSYGCEPACPASNTTCVKHTRCTNHGCYCIKGYTRNSKGTCIPSKYCKATSCTGHHEELKLVCADCSNKKENCNCQHLCVCKEGFKRNSSGTCTTCSGPNEEFKCGDGCDAHCAHKECIPSKKCIDGCYCKPAYARNSTGACIPKTNCNTGCSKPNQELKLVCDDDCPKNDKTCKRCKNICSCIKGYIKMPDGSCVLSEPNDHKKCSKPHEEHTFNFGCELTCTPYGIECIDRKIFGFCCSCMLNYVRDVKGNCIHLKQCNAERCKKPFEVFRCSYGCEDTYPPSDKYCRKGEECKHGCYCAEGYARDSKGDCVMIKNCKPNEELKCSHGCEATCPSLTPILCVMSRNCKIDCVCSVGYVRNPAGDCVRIKDCPLCKPREVIKCSYGCEPTCPTRATKPCVKNKICKHDCHCMDGYVRNLDGDCVGIEDCPSITSPPDPNNCEGQGKQFKCSFGCEPTCPATTTPCTMSNHCKHGCFCRHGYAEDSYGKCVRIEDCDEEATTQNVATTVTAGPIVKCPKPYEDYRCSYGCEATCQNFDSICFRKNTKCIPGCYCRHGHARDLDGSCVPLRRCKPTMTTTATSTTPSTVPELELNCTRPNEHYECGSACQTTCENYYKICPIANIVCNKGCYCNKGYARDSTKTCVPIKECSDRQNENCGDHEEYRLDTFVYNECITPPVYSITKHYGCYCIKGYKRNIHGKCIPAKDCPSTNGIICTGEYEHYECGSACQTTCKNYNKTCPITKIHCIGGCYCNIGYARNDKGVCIPVQHCNETSADHCPNHEEYKFESTTKYLCVQDYTRKKFKRVLACHCIYGYKRDCAGHCVPQEDCPVSCKICGENEEYRYAIDTSPLSKQRCRKSKVLKCHCIEGFRYDKTGKCVYDTGEICKANEVFSYDNYNNNACTADFSKQGNSVNVYRCHCRDGYKRNKSGQCIEEHQCPEEIFANCTRPNEHYECGSPCQKTCGNYMKPCRIQSKGCIKGCYCKKDHARDCTGTCIAIQDCILRENAICGKKEEYRLDTFINNECASNSISSIDHPPLMHGCYCIKGYKRNSEGVCIPENKC